MSSELHIIALEGIPMIGSGNNLSQIIDSAMRENKLAPVHGDIIVIAQKVVSKAEGRLVSLSTVTPSARAISLSQEVDKDPRLVELILRESRGVIRKKPGVLVTEHRLGWIMANAGIDASNISGDEVVLLLPIDSDKSCLELKTAFKSLWDIDVGVIVNDSFGRPWRLGTTGVALGAAGITSLWDRRGETDLYGRELMATQQAIADELAAAASLLQGQGAEGRPVVLIRGLDLSPGNVLPARPATDLLRDKAEDMFR